MLHCRTPRLTLACLRQIGFGLGLCLVFGCGPAPPEAKNRGGQASGPNWFEDVTASAGLAFVHQVDVSGRYLYPESIGSGAAFLDFNNDGRLDVYLIHNVQTSSAPKNVLLQQQADGTFKNVSAGSGLDVTSSGYGLAVGDLNNDGWVDVLMTEYDRVRLFKNLGNATFRDITVEAGLTNVQWSVPAAFVDYDRDGWLDAVIGNYLDFDPTQKCPDAKGHPDFCGPHGFPATVTRLYRNRAGEPGQHRGQIRFEDVTVASGLARAPGKAMEIVCADFNGDRWPDIFITDDGLPNRLFVNQRQRTFKEEALVRGLAYTGTGAAAANMGVALADLDGDSLFDLFVPHLAEESHTLWRQRPVGVFQDQTALAGLLNTDGHSTGFGAVFADFNCDGAPDLAVANGLVRRRLGTAPPSQGENLQDFWAPYQAFNQLFLNEGQSRFREISAANTALCRHAAVGRGLICGDVDNDGGRDLLLTSIGSPARLLRNVSAGRGNWIGIRAIDPALGGRDAYGAEIIIRAGERAWWGLVQPAYSYASSNDPRVHFGLGSIAEVQSIAVRWPDGSDEEFSGQPLNRYVVVSKGSGRMTSH